MRAALSAAGGGDSCGSQARGTRQWTHAALSNSSGNRTPRNHTLNIMTAAIIVPVRMRSMLAP